MQHEDFAMIAGIRMYTGLVNVFPIVVFHWLGLAGALIWEEPFGENRRIPENYLYICIYITHAYIYIYIHTH